MKNKLILLICIFFTFLGLIGCTNHLVFGGKNDLNEKTEKPPNLAITAGHQTIDAVLGTYSWNYSNGDGTFTGVEADSGPPPELVPFQKEELRLDLNSEFTLEGGKNDLNENTKKPPNLAITAGHQTIDAVLGTYSWNYSNGDGTFTGVEADSDPLPELVSFQKEELRLDLNSEFTLEFEVKPQEFKVNIWNDEKKMKDIEVNNFSLKPEDKGKIIYEVYAKWNQGSAHYAFVVNVE